MPLSLLWASYSFYPFLCAQPGCLWMYHVCFCLALFSFPLSHLNSALAHNRMVAFLLHGSGQMTSDPPEFTLKPVWFGVLWGSSLYRLFMYVSCLPPECPAMNEWWLGNHLYHSIFHMDLAFRVSKPQSLNCLPVCTMINQVSAWNTNISLFSSYKHF